MTRARRVACVFELNHSSIFTWFIGAVSSELIVVTRQCGDVGDKVIRIFAILIIYSRFFIVGVFLPSSIEVT